MFKKNFFCEFDRKSNTIRYKMNGSCLLAVLKVLQKEKFKSVHFCTSSYSDRKSSRDGPTAGQLTDKQRNWETL
jgi:hypothetical protein